MRSARERTLNECCGYGLFLQDPAGANIAAVVIGLGILALGDTTAASSVDEMERIVVVHAGNNTNVTHTTTARTALEEHEVTRL